MTNQYKVIATRNPGVPAYNKEWTQSFPTLDEAIVTIQEALYDGVPHFDDFNGSLEDWLHEYSDGNFQYRIVTPDGVSIPEVLK